MKEPNIYNVSKGWFNLSFENHKLKSNHTALIFYAIDLNNRLSWVKNFGLPAHHTCQVLNFSYKTFIKTLNELIEFGFIEMIEKSKNQHTSNIISLNLLYLKMAKQVQSKSKASPKQGTITKPLKPINSIPAFEIFKTYALENKYNIDIESLNLKYQSWIENDWKDGNGKEIKNWKSKLLNTIPYLKTVELKQDNKEFYPNLKQF